MKVNPYINFHITWYIYLFSFIGDSSGYVHNTSVIKCTPWRTITRGCQVCPSLCSIPDVYTGRGFAQVKKAMADRGLKAIWLGLRRTWLGEYLWLDCTTPSVYFASQKWAPELNCGAVNVRDGTIEAGSCHGNSRGVLCQRKGCRLCEEIEDPTLCVKINETCYIRKEISMNWQNAKDYCTGRRWHLAVFPRAEEASILTNLQNAFRTEYAEISSYWVGLRREEWSDTGNPEAGDIYDTNTLYWGPNQPADDGNCTVLIKRGQDYVIEVTNCNKRFSALCLSSGKFHVTGQTALSSCDTVTQNVEKVKNNTKEAAIPNSSRPERFTGNTVLELSHKISSLLSTPLLILMCIAFCIFLKRRNLNKRNTGSIPQAGDRPLLLQNREYPGIMK